MTDLLKAWWGRPHRDILSGLVVAFAIIPEAIAFSGIARRPSSTPSSEPEPTPDHATPMDLQLRGAHVLTTEQLQERLAVDPSRGLSSGDAEERLRPGQLNALKHSLLGWWCAKRCFRPSSHGGSHSFFCSWATPVKALLGGITVGKA
ncbi:MAG: hypothetical protein O3C21_05600 [Verrucomicrobia bacterium]|nr:hypothetical protein [Verrucomicrobiota bacterium]